ncbi:MULTISPECIES: hypothetical protein [unclassified Streptomyces]|uniref:hypothetical protein n=1 Tax=Streptomyces sp. NPDC127532 TaxID=3345399 RepID=UPI003641FB81
MNTEPTEHATDIEALKRLFATVERFQQDRIVSAPDPQWYPRPQGVVLGISGQWW